MKRKKIFIVCAVLCCIFFLQNQINTATHVLSKSKTGRCNMRQYISFDNPHTLYDNDAKCEITFSTPGIVVIAGSQLVGNKHDGSGNGYDKLTLEMTVVVATDSSGNYQATCGVPTVKQGPFKLCDNHEE